MRGCPKVLSVADTTELDFGGQQAEGLGSLSYEARVGYIYSNVCGDAGSIAAGWCSRRGCRRVKRDMRTSGGIKVSVRWTESYERVAEQPTTFPEMRLGYITDREGDIAVLMRRADELGASGGLANPLSTQPQTR
jgi:hypothetical protein